MKVTAVKGVGGVSSSKKLQLYRLAEERAMDRLSNTVILSDRGEHLAKLDSFEKNTRDRDMEGLEDLYYRLQKDVSTIHSLESALDDKEKILMEMRELAYWEGEYGVSRKQREFDEWTRRLNDNIKDEKLLTMSFYNKIDNELVKKIKAIDAEKLGLSEDIYSGRIGKLTIRSMEGKPIRISIMYGEGMDREITVDHSKNTGDIVVNMHGERKGRYMEYRVFNEDIKLVLEKLGFEVIIDKGNEKKLADIGFTKLALEEKNRPLSIKTEAESDETLDRIELALDSIVAGRRDLQRTEEALKSILRGLDYLCQKRFTSVQEAISFIDSAKLDLVERPEDIVFSSRFKYNRQRIRDLLS